MGFAITRQVKFNITLSELEKAVAYAKKEGDGEFKTVFLSHKTDGIGGIFSVGTLWHSDGEDITNYDAW